MKRTNETTFKKPNAKRKERGEVITDLKTLIPDRRRRYEQRHRQLGLCIMCGNIAEYNKKRCTECLKKKRELSKSIYDRNKRLGLCVLCGKPLSEIDIGYVCHQLGHCKPSRRTT